LRDLCGNAVHRIRVRDQILVVDPRTLEIVDVIQA
jgi:hypothetical protein